LSRRPDGELQYLAEREQVRIPRPDSVVLPEINAGRADAHLVGNLGNRRISPHAGITQMLGEVRLTRQFTNPYTMCGCQYRICVRDHKSSGTENDLNVDLCRSGFEGNFKPSASKGA